MLSKGLKKVEKKKERQKKKAKKKAEAKVRVQNDLELVLIKNEDGIESDGSVAELGITDTQTVEQNKAKVEAL